MSGRSFGGSNLGKRRVRSEEDYFDDDLEEEDPAAESLEYQPAPDSPSRNAADDSDDSDDPLDAFMAGIEKEVKQQDPAYVKEEKEKEKKKKGVRDDIEDEDVEEAYYRYMEENPMAGVIQDEEDEFLEYDADGNPILPDKKMIDPLPPVDHDDIDYAKFTKNFYEVHEEIRNLSIAQVDQLRTKLGIRVCTDFMLTDFSTPLFAQRKSLMIENKLEAISSIYIYFVNEPLLCCTLVSF